MKDAAHIYGLRLSLSIYSVADAYLFTVLNWSKWVKIDLAPWLALLAYQARVAARPGVQQALKKEGLL